MLPDAIAVPAFAREIAERLSGAGHDVWCVGGAVRDAILGLDNTDVDLATSARPEEIQSLFRRTVPIGVEHGTVAVLDRNNTPHEVTSFRKDVQTDGRHATVEFGASLEEDLARRDFTINAIAYHPLRGEWRDPFNGARDLEDGVVRAVGDPRVRFTEDYLRILRAIRFACRFDFSIEGSTWDAACALVEHTGQLSAERVHDEWSKSLRTATSIRCVVERWVEAGAADVWIPELQRHPRSLDERLVSLERLSGRDPVVATALLVEDGSGVFKRLRGSNREVQRAAAIAQYQDRWPNPSDAQHVRRWLAEVGGAADDLVLFSEAQNCVAGLREAVMAVRKSGAALTVGELQIDGNRLSAIGVEPGPRMGLLLNALLDDVLNDPSRNQADWLEARARELAQGSA